MINKRALTRRKIYLTREISSPTIFSFFFESSAISVVLERTGASKLIARNNFSFRFEASEMHLAHDASRKEQRHAKKIFVESEQCSCVSH